MFFSLIMEQTFFSIIILLLDITITRKFKWLLNNKIILTLLPHKASFIQTFLYTKLIAETYTQIN